MADSAADVPSKYDVLIDGHGYIFADDTDSPYFSRHSTYTFTPTFLERTNISGNYGDNQQAFYMTLSQHDWSEGEGQRFVDVTNQDSESRAWRIKLGDPRTIPGQVNPTGGLDSGTMGFVSTNQSLYGIAAAPTEPNFHAVSDFSKNIYLAHSTGVVQWNTGLDTYFNLSFTGAYPSRELVGMIVFGGEVTNSGTGLGYSEYLLVDNKLWTPSGTTGAWSTFLDTANAGPMCFMNNEIFAFDGTTLLAFDTSGVSTILYQFKTWNGVLQSGEAGKVIGTGGKVYFLRAHGRDIFSSELWSYDGTATHIELRLPYNAVAYNLCESEGVIFIGGYMIDALHQKVSGTTYVNGWPTVWAFDGSNFNVAWKAQSSIPITGKKERWPCADVAPYEDGVAFAAFDGSTSSCRLYYLDVGGTLTTIGEPSGLVNQALHVAAQEGTVFLCQGQRFGSVAQTPNKWFVFPSVFYANTTIDSSLFDGGTSLTKWWKDVAVEFDEDQVGDSVDIYYQLNSVDGSYTLLQSNATSGQTYSIGQSATSLSIRVVLNPTASTYVNVPPTPRLKRVLLRGVPLLDTYRRASYLLDCSGNKMADPPQHVTCRNGQPHPLDGDEQRVNIQATIAKKTPITIIDRFGTYTGIIEPDQSTFEEVRQDYGRGEYKATIMCREV